MNKSELVDAVASGAGVSRGDAEGVLTTFFDTVQSSTKSGDTVSWPGFGKFRTAPRAARTARNPQTGQSVKVKASTAMKFTPSSVLKVFLNTKGTGKKKAPARASASSAARGAGTSRAASGGRATTAKATATKATPAKAAAKATATRSTASKATATKSTASKAAAGKAPAKKAPATKSTATRGTASRGTASKAPAKKAPAKRSR